MATTTPSNVANSDFPADSIDSRRAQQLIERALALAERSDLPAAVLACRQSIALAPESSQGYSVLGLLLERAGDGGGAIAAYEKVLQLAPDSLLERESLGRLRVSTGPRRARDKSEKLAETLLPAPARSTPDAAGSAVPAAVSAPVIPSNASPSTQAAIAADAIASAAAVPLGPSSIPETPHIPKPMLPFSPPARIAPSQGAPINLDWPVKTPTLSEKLKSNPSFYFRGAPLAVTAILSLGMLLWAHNYASSRAMTEVSTGSNLPGTTASTTNPNSDLMNNANPNVAPANPENPNTATGNAENTVTPATAGTTATTTAPVRAPSTPAATTPTRPASGAANPRVPAPAPQPSTPAASAGDGGNYPPMPVPRLGNPAAPDDTVRIVPGESDNGEASAGGSPLNPGGARDRGYVRINPGGGSVRPPVRSENTAASEERAAGTSARSGDNAAAISRMTRSIESGGGDTAFRYQQRAQLYLQSGDNNRAINDFQTAVAAYNDMIERNERVSFARSGIQASQRGIQIAQQRR